MKFIADENIPKSIVTFLRGSGHDVTSIYETNRGMKDDDILKRSFSELRVLITNDSDFGELIFYRKLPACGVILFRLPMHAPDFFLKRMIDVLSDYHKSLLGHFLLVSETQVRIRPIQQPEIL